MQSVRQQARRRRPGGVLHLPDDDRCNRHRNSIRRKACVFSGTFRPDHRGRSTPVYLQKYKDIFDHFDALVVGLTATPRDEVDRNTYDFFQAEHGVPTYLYEYKTAVERDHYLVPFYNIEAKPNSPTKASHTMTCPKRTRNVTKMISAKTMARAESKCPTISTRTH